MGRQHRHAQKGGEAKGPRSSPSPALYAHDWLLREGPIVARNADLEDRIRLPDARTAEPANRGLPTKCIKGLDS